MRPHIVALRLRLIRRFFLLHLLCTFFSSPTTLTSPPLTPTSMVSVSPCLRHRRRLNIRAFNSSDNTRSLVKFISCSRDGIWPLWFFNRLHCRSERLRRLYFVLKDKRFAARLSSRHWMVSLPTFPLFRRAAVGAAFPFTPISQGDLSMVLTDIVKLKNDMRRTTYWLLVLKPLMVVERSDQLKPDFWLSFKSLWSNVVWWYLSYFSHVMQVLKTAQSKRWVPRKVNPPPFKENHVLTVCPLPGTSWRRTTSCIFKGIKVIAKRSNLIALVWHRSAILRLILSLRLIFESRLLDCWTEFCGFDLFLCLRLLDCWTKFCSLDLFLRLKLLYLRLVFAS